MHVPLTFAILAALTVAMVFVHFLWPRFSRQTQLVLTTCACVVPALFVIIHAARWSTSSNRLNSALYWLCIGSYELLLVIFTRLRPRWLTSIIAIILVVPVLSASVFLPLTFIFKPPPAISWIGNHFISERLPWGVGPAETSGTDLTIYYRPPWAPFLQREVLSSRYYGGQCEASAAYALLQPDRRSALMVCPPLPGQLPESGHRSVWPFK